MERDTWNELRTHNAKLITGGVAQRMLFDSLRNEMLRQLISCNGAKSVDDLVDILQKEMETGVPSSVPNWYHYNTPLLHVVHVKLDMTDVAIG